MPNPNNWTRQQTLAALHIYLELPFGQLDQQNPKIKQLAGLIGRTPGAVALKLVNLASLDPQIIASGRAGMANASNQDKAIWKELQSSWDTVAMAAASEYEKYAVANGLPPAIDVIDEVPEVAEGQTRSAIVQVRVNQVRFRRAILANYNSTCCISGLRHEKLVIASHIVPWSVDKMNRLNPQNGLCLSALHDKAYDQGLLTIMPDYVVRLAPSLLKSGKDEFLKLSLTKFDGQTILLPEKLRPDPAFLALHAKRFGFIQ